MKDAAHAVKLARGAMNKQGNAICFGKKLSAKGARQPVATAGTGLPRSKSGSSMEPGYQKVEVRQLCARAAPAVVAIMLDKLNATSAIRIALALTLSKVPGAESFFSFSSKSLRSLMARPIAVPRQVAAPATKQSTRSISPGIKSNVVAGIKCSTCFDAGAKVGERQRCARSVVPHPHRNRKDKLQGSPAAWNKAELRE
jgi:hypothetical protein